MNAVLGRKFTPRNRHSGRVVASAASQVPLNPDHLRLLLQNGNQLHKAGCLAEAENVFGQVLLASPDQPLALLSLGILAHQRDAHEEAIRLIGRAIEIAPNHAQARYNLGRVYMATHDYQQAIEQFNHAIALNPNYADAHFNLGFVQRLLGRFEAARTELHLCRAIAPTRADVHFEIAQCCLKLDDRAQAETSLRVAIIIDPKYIAARLSLGTLLCSTGRYADALPEYQNALKYEGNNLRALNGLGECLKRAGRFDEALASLNRAIELEPDDAETLNSLATLHQQLGDNDLAAAYYERVLTALPDAQSAEKGCLFVALNRSSLSSQDLFDLHLRLRGRRNRSIDGLLKFRARDRDPDKKLRIGYVSSDFQRHVIALNLMPLLANHDRDSVEIFLYSHERAVDPMTKEFKALATRYTTINHLKDADAAKLIEADGIDILVLLAGRFDENRPLIASYRAAPIQVSFHDCATSGLADMDYWLTDSILHPADTPEHFTERLFRLPAFYQYAVQDDLPPIAPLPALRNGFVTFGCFNKPEKINQDVVSLWAEILHAVPDSKLFLKYFNHYSEASMQRHWIDKFAACGIAEDRLLLKAKHDSRARHLELYNEIDIALDPFPFNGATTTFEALSMGVPVVNLLGRHFVDRVAASMTIHAGFREFVADDRDAYVAVARNLAADMNKLDDHRRGMRGHLHASPLCRGADYARTIEAAYRDMWQTWCETGGYRER